MYLSQLILDVEQPRVRHDLANRYELHRTLTWAFAGLAAAHPLWRMELTRPGEPPCLLVQSAVAPDWEEIGKRHQGYFVGYRGKPLDLSEQLAPGQRLRFRLEANPTVTREGKRHGLWRVEEQLAWLDRQGERGGFGVESAVVTRAERLLLRKPVQTRPIVLYAVLFDGYLRVRDASRLGQVMAEGIGHGKALGLGLLSLGAG